MSAVHLIPVGITAAVPWMAAMSTLEPGHTPATVNASATLLALDLTRRARTGDPIAITAPEPCHDLSGHSLPFLAYAEEEGNYLHRRHRATHFTRANASKEHFLEAVRSQPAYLHLAVHGQIEPHEHASAQLIWTADPTAGPQVTHLEDISTHPISCGLVFLAACWGGTPDRLLPEESISFPTALLRAGALTVIAPLWPIEDATAKAVAVKFYDNWVSQGLSAAQALQRACTQVKSSRRHQNATWAAFQMAGRNLRYSDT
jgi:CHAT domain-containing protein